MIIYLILLMFCKAPLIVIKHLFDNELCGQKYCDIYHLSWYDLNKEKKKKKKLQYYFKAILSSPGFMQIQSIKQQTVQKTARKNIFFLLWYQF